MSNNLRYSEIMVNNGALNIQTATVNIDHETIQQASWTRNITKPHPHDVLSGRGNGVNMHPGNQYFRSLVAHLKNEYVISERSDKPMFAKLIHGHIRALNPPGRFLKRETKDSDWIDMGDKKAIEKTRQALREDADKVMKEIEIGKRRVETHLRMSLSTALNSAPQTLLQQQQSIRSMATNSSAASSNAASSNATPPLINNNNNNNPVPDQFRSMTSLPDAILDNLIKMEVQKNNLSGSLKLPMSFTSFGSNTSNNSSPLSPSQQFSTQLGTLNEEDGIKELDDDDIRDIFNQVQIPYNDSSGEGIEDFPGGKDDEANNGTYAPINPSSAPVATIAPTSSSPTAFPFSTRRELKKMNMSVLTHDSATAYAEEFPGVDIQPKPFDSFTNGGGMADSLNACQTKDSLNVGSGGYVRPQSLPMDGDYTNSTDNGGYVPSQAMRQDGNFATTNNNQIDDGGDLVFNDLYTGQPVRARASFIGYRNSLYHPDLHRYHAIENRTSSIIVTNFVKELQALEELDEFIDIDGEEEKTNTDIRQKQKRKFSDVGKAISHFRQSLSTSITEFHRDMKRMDLRQSKRASLLLRQTVFNSCRKLEAREHKEVKGVPVVKIPDLFNEKKDRRRSTLTESTKQLLEMVFGTEQHLIPLGAEKEILANILDPSSTDELMRQLSICIGLDDEDNNDQENADINNTATSALNDETNFSNLQVG